MHTGNMVRYGVMVLVIAGIALGAPRILTAVAQEAGASGGIKGLISSIRGDVPGGVKYSV